MKNVIWILAVSVLLVGCAGPGGGVDENKTPAQISEEVKTMDVAQIQAKIEAYKTAIEKKSAELEPVIAKLKEIPVTQLMGEEAKQIKADVEDIKNAISVLKEKLDVYVKALNEKQ
jgi:PBP1b-binding outer membrane lipoprotein LpoB